MIRPTLGRIGGPAFEDGDIDLGDGHWLTWTSWACHGAEDDPKAGAIVTHTTDKTESGLCEGFITLNPDANIGRPHWTVESWEPLTLSPSLLCHCGDHGFIRGGKWVRA